MSELLVTRARPAATAAASGHARVGGLGYVGFEVARLGAAEAAERDSGERELCVVVVAGRCTSRSEHGDWRDLGGARRPVRRPARRRLPPARHALHGRGRRGGGRGRPVLRPGRRRRRAARAARRRVDAETRGHGAHERAIHPILMGDEAADALLVCEVSDARRALVELPAAQARPRRAARGVLPRGDLLPPHRTRRRASACSASTPTTASLDETLAVGDRDCVLVPRGYHTVSAPPGYALYYLNVMAGPTRAWAVANDPDHEWTLEP